MRYGAGRIGIQIWDWLIKKKKKKKKKKNLNGIEL